jgi:adenosylcobinamide kinase/adenosylcobinamide-phosphate guanylyltransferase
VKQEFPKLSLILGGANSGKSAFAEALTRAANMPKTYVATAQAFDDEMRDKIAKHRKDRGADWETVEAPMDIASVLGDGVTLVDCLTLWLSNHLLAEVDVDTSGFLKTCDQSGPVVCVSNEAGLGVVPDNALARRFRSAQGQLNQDIAAHADLVVLVTAGLPMVLKGHLPKGLS